MVIIKTILVLHLFKKNIVILNSLEIPKKKIVFVKMENKNDIHDALHILI